MITFEVLYLIFGSYITTAGTAMVIIYTLTNPWWKTHIGRMMITYAVAEILMSVILMITVIGHVSPEWFRAVWFALQVVVGTTFWFQAVTIIRLHRERRRTEKTDR